MACRMRELRHVLATHENASLGRTESVCDSAAGDRTCFKDARFKAADPQVGSALPRNVFNGGGAAPRDEWLF